MIQKDTLYGYYVSYDDEVAYDGFAYLRDRLDQSEAIVFFHEASRIGKADFEDDYGRDFTLTKNDDGTFTITRR